MTFSTEKKRPFVTIMEEEAGIIGRETARAVRDVTDRTKTIIRGATSSVLGPRVGNAWRANLYPNDPAKVNPAGFVYTRAPNIIDAFNKGGEFRPTRRHLFAIPTDAAKRIRGRDAEPADFKGAGLKLDYVPPRGARRVGFLVLKDARVSVLRRGQTARVRERSKKTGRLLGAPATVIMFILVPKIRLQKRLDIETHRENAGRDLQATLGNYLRDAR